MAGTCCHRCGHVHEKGTSCPKPYLTGDRSCVKRANESLREMSLMSTGIEEFLDYVENDAAALEHLKFASYRDLVEFLQDATYREWDELRSELEQYKQSQQQPITMEGLKDPEDNPCWKGYHPIGLKDEIGRAHV